MIKALKRFFTGGGGGVKERSLAGSRLDPASPPAFKPEIQRLNFKCPKCHQPHWERYATGKFIENMPIVDFMEFFKCSTCGYGEQ